MIYESKHKSYHRFQFYIIVLMISVNAKILFIIIYESITFIIFKSSFTQRISEEIIITSIYDSTL